MASTRLEGELQAVADAQVGFFVNCWSKNDMFAPKGVRYSEWNMMEHGCKTTNCRQAKLLQVVDSMSRELARVKEGVFTGLVCWVG